MSFESVYRNSALILTEGALAERLKSEFRLKMDAHINHAGFIYQEPQVLEKLYRQYIEIGRKHDLPVMVMTPTRKVNVESLGRSEFHHRNILSDAVTFLRNIRESYGGYADKILIGGLLGCKGDAYSGEKRLNALEAYHFHKQQTSKFQRKETDFLFAGIMPEIQEATGMARAMSETGIPYIISFMVQQDGCLLDGTSIADAISFIDQENSPEPVCYFTNCIHPANFRAALNNAKNKGKPQINRLTGTQANASALSCADLNNCDTLHQDDFNNIIEEMLSLQRDSGIKIFGGCCGTDDRFMEDLADKLMLAVSEDK